MPNELAGVVPVPGLVTLRRVELVIELDEHIDELAANGRVLKEIGQFSQPDQPIRIPGRPVRVDAVAISIDRVMCFARLAEERCDAISVRRADARYLGVMGGAMPVVGVGGILGGPAATANSRLA